MPIRLMRPRKSEGLKQFIVPLYERPVLKFLAWSEPYAPLATLIFGYPYGLSAAGKASHRVNGEFTAEHTALLRDLWLELRGDIIAAQQQYQPDKKPWGARFDKKTRAKQE